MDVKVGYCGFSAAQERYFKTFRMVELQSTFYKLPRESTLQRWHKSAPPDFEFAVKAWQVITHPSSSPTWKRSGLTIGKVKAGRYGYLRPTLENFEAFNHTLDACETLQARVCVVQCPSSFHATFDNVSNLKRFFTRIDRHGIMIAWEPRGDWLTKPQLVRELCDQHHLVHVVDLLRRNPLSSSKTLYFRLHGLGQRELNYGYRYTNRDLELLLQKLSAAQSNGCEEAYVLFDNISMFENAKRFSRLMST